LNFSNDAIHTIENLIYKYKVRSFSIYIITVLALAGGIFAMPYLHIDISSQSRGIIRSKHENIPVTSVVSGRIVYSSMKNNTYVTEGDTLINIAVDNLEVENEVNKELVKNYTQNYNDLDIILKGEAIVPISPVYKEEFLKFNAQKAELESKMALAKLRYDRGKSMHGDKLIAKSEYEAIVFDYEYAQKALQSLVRQQYAIWQNQKSEILLKIKNIEGYMQKIEVQKENYIILAPESGTVANFIGIQTGSYINAGQPIADISPDHDLIVETAVSPDDIGLIKTGQTVKFQMDAFNYNQWGLLSGKVTDIDKNATISDNNTYFKVRCTLDSFRLSLKSGYSTDVKKGMTMTSRFMITRRSLFDLLFDKVDDWLNPKLMKN
jgi:membrane fusion protein, peptide pheromone/bacteriocin exporter